MPTREEILEKFTFKEDYMDLELRVYYSLHQDEKLQVHRVSKLLALLIKHLHNKRLLDNEEIDGLLIDAIYG